MYKLLNDTLTNQLGSIKRLSDNAVIPLDPANTDYQEYLEWTKASPMNVAAQPEEE